MKTIITVLVMSICCFIFFSAVPQERKLIILHPEDKMITDEGLEKSSTVISQRLTACGIKAELTVNMKDREIEILLSGETLVTDVSCLLTGKGEIRFFETFTIEELGMMFPEDLIRKSSNPSEARLFCLNKPDPGQLMKYQEAFEQVLGNGNFRLCREFPGDGQENCLYALKTAEKASQHLSRTDILEVKPGKADDLDLIQIRFTKEASTIWAETTAKNINRPIAIVVDDQVFFSPVVRDVIKTGTCELSGKFDKKKISCFLAMVQNDQLPSEFRLEY